jgi:hypothetical protein
MNSRNQPAGLQTDQVAHQTSRVDGPCMLYGSVGLWLAVAMQLIGLFKVGDEYLMSVLYQPVFNGNMPEQVSLPIHIVVAAVFCYGLAFIVLDVLGAWRRLLIGTTVLVLTLAMVPTLAVWNIYFSPFLTAFGVCWTWFCTMMYVNHHIMPCEVLVYRSKTSPPQLATPKVPVEQEVPKTQDNDNKYQPVEQEVEHVKERTNG